MHRRPALVLFDLDGTLLDHDRAEQEGLEGWAATQGWPRELDGLGLTSVWHQITEEAFADYRCGNLTFQGQRRVRVRRLLSLLGDDRSTVGDDVTIDALFEDFWTRYRASWTAFPDAVRCVQAVSQERRVAVLSNGDLSEKLAKVEAIGLVPYVEITLASSDLGCAKPDRRAFLNAMTRLGVDAREVLHVGDRLDVDVHAAIAAGLSAVWLNRGGHPNVAADVDVIVSLDELPALLSGE